jgi:hypothetical protein
MVRATPDESDSSKQPIGLKPARLFEPQCSTCFDIGWVGGRRCECAIRRRIADKLDRLNRRYAKFASLDLMSLVPDVDRHPKQSKVIPKIQANPEASVVMFGPTNTGKTLLGYVMAKYAIEQGRPVVAITLAELLDQYRAQVRDPEKLPIVDAETLSEAEGRYLIFIDEADKARPTAFAGDKFFHLVNAASQTMQQVIIASNKPKPALMAHWERAGQASDEDAENSCYGEPIMRRLCELPGAIEVSFF